MPSIALIGPDGSGKTTLARMLEDSERHPIRYLYMGVNTASSNLALPTSRLADLVKQSRWFRRRAVRRASGVSGRRSGGRIRAVARLVNRLAEVGFRQTVALVWMLRGYTVLYDRHFLFDYSEGMAQGKSESLERRIHRWMLARLCPAPGLVIFLDAPGEVLFARKGESSPEELERRRRRLLDAGEAFHGFVRIDAARPLPEVYEEVSLRVGTFLRGRTCASRRGPTGPARRVAR